MVYICVLQSLAGSLHHLKLCWAYSSSPCWTPIEPQLFVNFESGSNFSNIFTKVYQCVLFQSIFSQSVFFQSVFFQSVFSQGVFSQSVFFQSVFFQSVFFLRCISPKCIFAKYTQLTCLCEFIKVFSDRH